ncbi:ATP-dependent DNA ligase, partial [Escherichia coli]|nr:ATP-dependent DNA ligase [Escherichia coli]
PPPEADDDAPLHRWVDRLGALRAAAAGDKPALLESAWRALDARSRFLFNKLITGGLRVGVSRLLVTRALSLGAGVPAETIAQRLIGYLAS